MIRSCRQCQQDREHHAHGLCHACYAYEHTNGVPRPADTIHYAALPGGSPFGRHLRALRRQHRYSQTACARRAQMDHGYLSRLETGDKPVPSRPVVLALARALDLKAGERDALLIAAGYAPDWLQAAVDDPTLLHELWYLARHAYLREEAPA